MTLAEMKKKVLGLIEELNPNSELLTDDPDIATKYNEVANQVMFELARMKKIPKYVEMAVTNGQVVTMEDIGSKAGYDVYQVANIAGAGYKVRAGGTVFRFTDNGLAEIDVYVYPVRITEKNQGNYTYELSQDALEIMPYGIAADLLKSDVSANYGNVYANRYESMLNRLDPRYMTTTISIQGGVDV
jgi:hypothetical protein